MRIRRQEFIAFSAAAGFHVAALFLLRASVGDLVSIPRPAAPPHPEVSVDIDFGELAGAETHEEILNTDRNAPSERGQRVETFAVLPSGRNVTRAPGEARDEAAPESGNLAPHAQMELDEHDHEAATSPKPIDLGIGPDGWRRWVTPGTNIESARAAPSAPRKNRFQVFRAPPVSTTGGLQEGLEEKDRALGLGPSGRVLSALHNAAHTTAAPYVGTARFDVTVHRTGVVEVTLGAASGEVAQWKKVAAHIASDLRAAPPRIAPPRERLTLVVELVAEETMPNGTKVSSLVGPHLEASPLKLESTEKSREEVSKDNPTTKDAEPVGLPPIKLDLPGVYLAERGKVCSYRLGVSVLGPVFQGGCDPSHIGAKPQRMVRARVVEQRLF